MNQYELKPISEDATNFLEKELTILEFERLSPTTQERYIDALVELINRWRDDAYTDGWADGINDSLESGDEETGANADEMCGECGKEKRS